jgi:hypothetical protein
VDHDPVPGSPPDMRQVGYAFIFLGGILLAMNSRDTEVSAYSETKHVHGYEHDRYCLARRALCMSAWPSSYPRETYIFYYSIKFWFIITLQLP